MRAQVIDYRLGGAHKWRPVLSLAKSRSVAFGHESKENDMVNSCKTDASPRDIANTAEGHVVTLLQRLISSLLHLSLMQSDTEPHLATQARQTQEIADLTAAAAYLEQTFEPAFIAAAHSVSDPLREARQTLSAEVGRLIQKLPAPEETIVAADVLALAARTETVVIPAVGTFFGALFDHVVACEKTSAKRAQDIDSGALSEIVSILRKMNFIAVNAAVEAARVGDVGRRFAVIAAETKDLSQKLKEAVERMRIEMV